jgi:two-component system heavy metal sensor histidine kinase CusS
VGTFLYDSLATELQRRDDIEITGKLNQFLQLIRDQGSMAAVRSNPTLFHEVLLSHPGVYLGIFDENNTPLVEHSDLDAVDLLPVVTSHHALGVPYTCEPEGIGLSRCISGQEVLPGGGTVRVSLVRTASDRRSLLDRYRIDVLLAMAAGAVLVGTLGYAIASRGFRPVRSIGRQTSRIEAHNLGERLDIRGGPLELQDIALSVNRMLDRLERAFVRLSQFSSDLAHDMRTALIDSNIEECERLQRMTENMLFLARTDNATQHLALGTLDAQSELLRLASYFQGLAEEAGVDIVVEADARIWADAGMFRRAVSNLVSNALAHAIAGTAITLCARESSRHAIVSVMNLGECIAPEHIEKIFERFYRVDPSRHGSAKNTGLGLAIVKSIVELHRGKVDVVSSEGKTTFTLRFPRQPGA